MAMRNDRSVTPPPPQKPSPSYLALSQQDPSHVDNPTSSRKLLVLDLNGTLLHRSPHNFRPKHRAAEEDRRRDRHGNFLPRLRPVHPRPYMPAFRNYLFHTQTRSWLDVMVWSSAQPHSVGDMVDKCFGKHKNDLLAIWARDTLGLSSEHYFQKVQTIKDLAKPWSLLSPKSTDNPPSPHNSIASTPRTSPEPSSPSRPSDDSIRPAIDISAQAHSALTTLLLDDSPRKAELQPFNHVCIGEYTGVKHVKDLESLQKEQDWAAALDARQQLNAHMDKSETASSTPATAAAAPTATTTADSGGEQATAADADVSQGSPSKKRKRKEKKLQKRAALLEQATKGVPKPEAIYDETLLAVIGVLDEIKSQANVAAWIRGAGLWGSYGAPTSTSDSHSTEVVTTTTTPPTSSKVTLDALNAKAEDEAASESDDSTLSVDKRPKKRARVREPTPGLTADVGGNEDVVAVGNDEVTAVPASTLPASEAVAEVEAGDQMMWFEHADVFAWWAGRGRKALEGLGISAEHGIER